MPSSKRYFKAMIRYIGFHKNRVNVITENTNENKYENVFA